VSTPAESNGSEARTVRWQIKRTNLVAPFDAVCGSARSAIEVAWLTIALTLVCVVALPILLVLGQFVVNAQVNFEDWLKTGWPR
jgi:hypothetical protein